MAPQPKREQPGRVRAEAPRKKNHPCPKAGINTSPKEIRMPTPKSAVITTRVTARDAQVLRSVAALEDVTLSSVASRALRDFTARLTASAPATGTVNVDG